MIRFLCQCGESFRIEEKNLLNKSCIKCPNCSETLSFGIQFKLLSYAESYKLGNLMTANNYLEQAINLSQNKNITDWQISVE